MSLYHDGPVREHVYLVLTILRMPFSICPTIKTKFLVISGGNIIGRVSIR